MELQFLLLNDFRLRIPLAEMQRYGDRLLGYWEGREGEMKLEGEVMTPSIPAPQPMDNRQQGNHPGDTIAMEDPSVTVTKPDSSESMAVDESNPAQPLPESSETASAPPSTTQQATEEDRLNHIHKTSATVIPRMQTPIRKEEERGRNGLSRSGSGVAPGLSDWVRDETPAVVHGVRMSSPMRD